MCPRAQPGRQISETKLAPFPWCTFKEGSPAHSPPWAGKGWGMVPSTLSLVPPSGIIVNAHQKPHSGILCQESVPWSVSQKPLWAASMLCSAHTGHLHINTQLWLKCNYHWQDTSWDPGPQSCCQALLLPQANPFTALSPCKAGGCLLYFHTNHWIYGSKLLHKSWTSVQWCFCSITFATLTFGEFQKTKHSPEIDYSQVITQHTNNLGPLKLSPPCTLQECYLLVRALFINHIWFWDLSLIEAT